MAQAGYRGMALPRKLGWKPGKRALPVGAPEGYRERLASQPGSNEADWRVRRVAGLVDVKVCAVDEVWGGLKFVRRVKDRGAGSPAR